MIRSHGSDVRPIGARQTFPGSGVFRGYVDFIDVVAGSPVTQHPITSTGPAGVLPLHLTMTRDRSEVAVRSSDTLADTPAVAGADVTFFSMNPFSNPPFAPLQGYGGTGYVMGLDSIAAGIKPSNNHKRVISTSEIPPPAPDGRVHLVDRL